MQARLSTKKAAEKQQMDAQQATLTATSLVQSYDERGDIQEQVNLIEDPVLRKKTMSEAMRLHGQKRQADNEARGDAFERAESHIINGGSAETYKLEDPEGWERLSAKQQRSVSSGKMVVTDWVKFSDVMSLSRDELAKVNPVDHFQDLAPSERKTLISAVKSANGTGSSGDKLDHQVGRTRNSQVTSKVEQIFGKKSKWSTDSDKADQVNAFYNVLDEEVRFREMEKGSALTSEEFTNLVDGLSRKVTVEGFIFDSEMSIKDVPAADVPPVTQFLRDNGIPVTSDNIIKAYQQATQ